jgi:hypothetical protein
LPGHNISRGENNPMDYQELKSRNEELTELIGSLSNSQRQLTLCALDYQALGLAKRHEREKAIELADELGKVLEILIRSLKKKVYFLSNLIDSERMP